MKLRLDRVLRFDLGAIPEAEALAVGGKVPDFTALEKWWVGWWWWCGGGEVPDFAALKKWWVGSVCVCGEEKGRGSGRGDGVHALLPSSGLV